MSIYATVFDLDDDNHEPGQCGVFEEVPKEAGGWDAATADGRFWRRVEAPCTCGNRPPLIYRGSHVNPSADGPRGGALLVCGIPDHCHPDARWGDDDHGKPVKFLRISAYEDGATEGGNHPGQATLVLDVAQVVQLRDSLTKWIDTRGDPEEDLCHEPEEEPGPCTSCERCTWNPGPDCGKADHPHCPTCAHCAYRHEQQQTIWEALLFGMLDQYVKAEPVTLPAGVVSFDASMSGLRSYRLVATLANGDKISAERTFQP